METTLYEQTSDFFWAVGVLKNCRHFDGEIDHATTDDLEHAFWMLCVLWSDAVTPQLRKSIEIFLDKEMGIRPGAAIDFAKSLTKTRGGGLSN